MNLRVKKITRNSYKLLKYFKNELLKIDESERNALWRIFIYKLKSENSQMISELQQIIFKHFEGASQEKIEIVKGVYEGKFLIENPSKEFATLLDFITFIELFGLETPKELRITIPQATAQRILSL